MNDPVWARSTTCSSTSCIAVAKRPGEVNVAHWADVSGERPAAVFDMLRVSNTTWAAFVSAVKNGTLR
jgi:hypothetical protein